MTYSATITSKRQFTIPSKLFKELGFDIGDKVVVSKEGKEMKIKRAVDLVEELAGSVSIPNHLKGVDLDRLIEDSIKEEYAQER